MPSKRTAAGGPRPAAERRRKQRRTTVEVVIPSKEVIDRPPTVDITRPVNRPASDLYVQTDTEEESSPRIPDSSTATPAYQEFSGESDEELRLRRNKKGGGKKTCRMQARNCWQRVTRAWGHEAAEMFQELGMGVRFAQACSAMTGRKSEIPLAAWKQRINGEVYRRMKQRRRQRSICWLAVDVMRAYRQRDAPPVTLTGAKLREIGAVINEKGVIAPRREVGTGAGEESVLVPKPTQSPQGLPGQDSAGDSEPSPVRTVREEYAAATVPQSASIDCVCRLSMPGLPREILDLRRKKIGPELLKAFVHGATTQGEFEMCRRHLKKMSRLLGLKTKQRDLDVRFRKCLRGFEHLDRIRRGSKSRSWFKNAQRPPETLEETARPAVVPKVQFRVLLGESPLVDLSSIIPARVAEILGLSDNQKDAYLRAQEGGMALIGDLYNGWRTLLAKEEAHRRAFECSKAPETVERQIFGQHSAFRHIDRHHERACEGERDALLRNAGTPKSIPPRGSAWNGPHLADSPTEAVSEDETTEDSLGRPETEYEGDSEMTGAAAAGGMAKSSGLKKRGTGKGRDEWSFSEPPRTFEDAFTTVKLCAELQETDKKAWRRIRPDLVRHWAENENLFEQIRDSTFEAFPDFYEEMDPPLAAYFEATSER